MSDETPASFHDLEHLRPVLEAVPDPMLVVDGHGRIHCMNGPARRLLGYTGEIEGQPVEVLIPPHLAEMHRNHRATYARQPRRRPMGSGLELSARRADGSELPVEVSLSPLTIGGDSFVMASLRDIGPQRRARDIQVRLHQQETLMALWEQALRPGAGEACMRSAVNALHELFDASRVRVYEIDADVEPVRVRAAADTDAAADDGWRDLDDVADAAQMFAAESHAAGHNLPPVAARLHQRRGGALLVLSLRSQGQMVGALAVSLPRGATFNRDQVYLAQNVAHLLANVLSRTRSDQLLLVAAKMEALGQLSGGIAHDFNNLLSIIAGNLEILGDRLTSDPGARRLLGAALGATRRGGELTHRLLIFARKRMPRPGPQHLAPLLDEFSDVLRHALGDGVELELLVDSDLPAVLVDPAVLEACLINLATNARDALPAGGTVAIRVHRSRLAMPPRGTVATAFRPGDYVAVDVCDSGEGMSTEVQLRAFEPFFTTKASGKGTGLGLSLVRSLTAQSGGYVGLESQPGDGTCVTLYLALAPTPAPVSPAAVASEVSSGHGEHVLVVEDEAHVRAVVCMLLEGLGYRCTAVGSVHAALQALRDHPDIGIVFSDVVLGRHGSGLELREHLSRSHPRLPLVLTSGYARPALERYGVDAAGLDILGKPYTRRELAAALATALERRQAADR